MNRMAELRKLYSKAAYMEIDAEHSSTAQAELDEILVHINELEDSLGLRQHRVTIMDEGRKNTAYLQNGVLRWVTSGNVPFDDMVQKFIADGFKVDAEACRAARNDDLNEVAVNYRKQREEYGYSDEEMFEMRAAFGEGVPVVDLFTGKVIK